MLKFYRFLILPLTAVFLASTAGIARYAADSCTQARMYRQLTALTENFPGDAVSPGNDFLPQYQALYAQNSDLAGWIQIDGTGINYPVMQSKHDPDFYLKHNFEKADSPHGCPYVQANCDLQTPSDNILVYGHNMKDGTMLQLLSARAKSVLSAMPALPKEHRWCSQAEKGNGTACTLQKIFWTWIISQNFPGMTVAGFVCRSPARAIAFCARIAATSNICGIP